MLEMYYKPDFNVNKFSSKLTKPPPHRLAYDAKRLCDKIGIPFNTILLRAIKTNPYKAETISSYMHEKGISNIRYFVKSFYNKT